MSDQQPRFKFTFHGPGSFGIVLVAIWFILFALSDVFKVGPGLMQVLAFFAGLLLLIGV